MPLPALNTQGIDIGNILLEIKQMEHMKRQNALLDYQLSPEMSDRQEQKSKLDYEKDLIGYARDSLQGIDPEEYPQYRDNMIGKGMNPSLLPKPETFTKPDVSGQTKIFDPEAFEKWRVKTLISTDKLIAGPKEGDHINFTMDTPDGPKEVTQRYEKGKWVEIGRGAKFAPKEPKAPTTRTIQRGTEKVSQEYDPATKTWTDVATGPAWHEQKPRVVATEEGFLPEDQAIRKKPFRTEADDKTLVEVQQPDGSVVYMKRSKAVGKPAPAKKGQTEADKRAAGKAIADTETKIRLNSAKQEISALVDNFNQMADKPYAYTWKAGKLYGGEWTQQPLPKTKSGRQITAAGVAEVAKQKNISYDEALQQIISFYGAK